jgi:hypothetical protein
MVVDLQELARRMMAEYDARTPGQLFGGRKVDRLSVNSFRAEFVEKYQVPECDSN